MGPRRAGTSRRAGIVVLISALLLGLLPVAGAAQTARPGATQITVSGLDGLTVGTAAAVTVNVRVSDRGALRDQAPLRLLGVLSAGGSPASATVALRRADGTFDTLEIDDEGRFVFPREDRTPLTLAGNPELETAEGYSATLRLTVPTADPHELSVTLVESNERSTAVVRHAGGERIETAAAISAASFNPGVATAYIARADEFPDALAGGPIAGLGGAPILLVYPQELPEATTQELRRLRPGRIAVLGGARAISEAVVDGLRPLTEGEVVRLAGGNRFATAATIALDRFPEPVDTVFVATGQVFADALSGGPAAALVESPILLVAQNLLPRETVEALGVLRPRRIVVLGGSAAVSDTVVGQLGQHATDGVTRWFGRTRFETSAVISSRSFDPAAVHTVLLATGLKFPDSLAGAPAAFLHKAPLLLVTQDTIPEAVRNEIARLGPAVVVLLGGGGVIGDAIADAVTLLTRTMAPDRSRFIAIGQPSVSSFTPRPGSTGPVDDACATDPSLGAKPAGSTTTSGRSAFARRAQVAAESEPRSAVTADAAPLGRPAPDAPLFTAASEGDVDITSPTAGSPRQLRIRNRFPLTFSSPAGAYQISYRPQGGDWTLFENPTAVGNKGAGELTVPLNAPLLHGFYDVRVTVDGVGADEEAGALDARVFVPGMPPPVGIPPFHTALIEGVSGQSQIFSVPPAGGLTYDDQEGTYLVVVLDRAERTHVDYPLDAEVQVLTGGPYGTALGTAELWVERDRWAAIYYQMDPDDQPPMAPGDAPTRYTFRIDGVDVADVHESVIGGFYRSDIDHGVNVVYTIGDGAPVSSPEVSDLHADSDWESQQIAFGIHPALPEGGTVTIDLSEAVDGGVDYSDAFVTFEGDGHGHEPPQMPGTVAFNEDRTAIVVTAGEGGWPTIQPPAEGPIPQLLVEKVRTPDIEETFAVTFTRSDRQGAGTTTFDVSPIGELMDAEASDLACGKSDQQQTLGVTLVHDLDPWTGLEISLGGAQRGGVDYSEAVAEVTQGSGSAEVWVESNPFDSYVSVEYWPGPQDQDGDRIEIVLDGVSTDAVHETHQAEFHRWDGYGATALFDIGFGSAFISPFVADLEHDQDEAWQWISTSLREDLPAGAQVVVDLSSAERGGADYSDAWVYGEGWAFHEEPSAPRFATALDVQPDNRARVILTALERLPAGTELWAEVGGIRTAEVDEQHEATFTRTDDGVTAITPFAIRRFPTLRDATATDLDKALPEQSQTFGVTVVGELEPGYGIWFDLNSAQFGGVDYVGATATVVSGNGSAVLWAEDDGPFSWVELAFEAGEDGLADGEVVEIRVDGVSTDDVDETHVVDMWRSDGYQGTSTTFDIGQGGVFAGSPSASDVFQHSPGDIRQFFSAHVAKDLAPGETVTIDLSAAQQGAVDYRNGTPDLWFGDGAVELVADEDSAVLTYTAPAGGLAAGEGFGAHIHELAATQVPDRYEAVFTHVPEGRSAVASFGVNLSGHDGFGGAAASAEADQPLVRPDGAPLRRPSGAR